MKIITISGASGSGKSTLAEHIHQNTPNSLLLSLDRYYLSKEEQTERNGFWNFDYPTALDTALLKENLATLKRDGRAEVPLYDFTVSKRAGYETVTTSNMVIIDGLFAGSLLEGMSDLNIFVDVDLDLALLRRIHRDMSERGRTLDSVTEQYINDVRPAYFKHIVNIKQNSDIILTNNTSTDDLIKGAQKVFDLINSNL